MTKSIWSLAAVVVLAAPPPSADHPSGTLVVANMNDNTATVLDAATGGVLATLPTGEGPHEVAISHDGRWALVSNYGVRGKPGNSLTLIDVAAAQVVRTITLTGYQRPHGMLFLPGDSIVAVTSESRQSVLLVRVSDGNVVAILPSKGRATHMITAPAAGTPFWVSNIADNTVSRIDPAGHDSTLVVHVGRQPEGIAIAPDGSTLWSGSNVDSMVVVVDPARGTPIDTVRGFGLPYRMAVTPDSRVVVITDPARAEIVVVTTADRRRRFTIVVPRDSVLATAEVPGSPSPEGVALSRDNHWAFVTLQGRNRVVTIDLDRGRITGIAPIGSWSDGIGYSPLQRGRL